LFAEHTGDAVVAGGALDPIDGAVANEQHIGWSPLDAEPLGLGPVPLGIDPVDGEPIAPQPAHGRIHGAAMRTVLRDKLQDDRLFARRFKARDKGRP